MTDLAFLWLLNGPRFSATAVAELFASDYLGVRVVKNLRWNDRRKEGGFAVGKKEFRIVYQGCWKVFGEDEEMEDE